VRSYSYAESASSLSKGVLKVFVSLALLAAALAVSVPVYGGWFSGAIEDVYRFGMPVLWGGLALVATRTVRLAPFRALLLSLFGVSLGFALAHVIGNAPLHWLGLASTTPKGAAIAKVFSEVIPVCTSIFFAASLAPLSLESLGLRNGRVGLSLGLGLLATVPLLALFAVDPSGSSKAVLALPASVLRSWFPWILAFSIANGFMEELWFRGLWLAAFKQAVGPSAAMHVTSLAFCFMHVIVYWREPTAILMLTPVWLYMGYAYAVIVRKTGSLWGAVLAHAIADVIFMYIYFTNG
jgi:membrane protease YdiL (CAAX protease family)